MDVLGDEAGDGGVLGELDPALQALSEAFDRAREVNYRPGSPQMQALEAAERDYQQAVRRRERARASRGHLEQPEPGCGQGGDPGEDLTDDRGGTVLELRADRTHIDLRTPTTQRSSRS